MSIWVLYTHLFVLFATSTIMVNVFEKLKIRWLFVATAASSVIYAFAYASNALIQMLR